MKRLRKAPTKPGCYWVRYKLVDPVRSITKKPLSKNPWHPWQVVELIFEYGRDKNPKTHSLSVLYPGEGDPETLQSLTDNVVDIQWIGPLEYPLTK